jgi:HNH endonuclease
MAWCGGGPIDDESKAEDEGEEGVESRTVARKQLLVLGIVATDRTFAATMLDGARAWVGKCIHCAAKLVISDSGQPMGVATIEHIWPQNLGGTNELVNLALACARCNREKGHRHDHKHAKDPRLLEIVERLRARRKERWREPDEVGLEKKIAAVYPPPDAKEADDENDDDV